MPNITYVKTYFTTIVGVLTNSWLVLSGLHNYFVYLCTRTTSVERTHSKNFAHPHTRTRVLYCTHTSFALHTHPHIDCTHTHTSFVLHTHTQPYQLCSAHTHTTTAHTHTTTAHTHTHNNCTHTHTHILLRSSCPLLPDAFFIPPPLKYGKGRAERTIHV